MSRFMSAMDERNKKQNSIVLGENGMPEHADTNDCRLSLFFSLVRGAPEDKIHSLLDDCIRAATISATTSTITTTAATSTAVTAANTATAVADYLADVFVLVIQTRDCRGGKGERDLFYAMFLRLFRCFPRTTIALLPLLVKYGCFKDFVQLLQRIGDIPEYTQLRQAIVRLLAVQLLKDKRKLDAAEAAAAVSTTSGAVSSSATTAITTTVAAVVAPAVSLCAKFAPREGTKKGGAAVAVAFKELRARIFPDNNSNNRNNSKQLYRRLLVRLNAALDVTEVKMCGKRYRDIDFNRVPSKCVNKYRKAFLNEQLKTPPLPHQSETGNRHPLDDDRVLCRKKLRVAVAEKKIKGKQLLPHEITRVFMSGRRGNSNSVSTLEIDMLQIQWDAIRQDVIDKLSATVAAATTTAISTTATTAATTATTSTAAATTSTAATTAAATTTAAPAVNLGRLVPLVDVSGSMSGTPMEVAIALGILVSEVNHAAFRDRLLTFSATPQWVDLTPAYSVAAATAAATTAGSIAEKVRITERAPWGCNTNIEAAFEKICEVARSHRLSAEELPDLIIFSDMQFDQAVRNADGHGSYYSSSNTSCNSYDNSTQQQRVQWMFARLGCDICGSPYAAPRIIYWNLRGNTSNGGFPAQSGDENVQLLSGFSPALLKFVTEGAPQATDESAETTAVIEGTEAGTTTAATTAAATTAAVGGKALVTPYETLRRVLDDQRYDAVRMKLAASEESALAVYSFTTAATTTNTITPGITTDATTAVGMDVALDELELGDDDWEQVDLEVKTRSV